MKSIKYSDKKGAAAFDFRGSPGCLLFSLQISKVPVSQVIIALKVPG